MYTPKINEHTYKYIHKIPTYAHCAPLHPHTILHMKTLPHTHLQKITPHDHHLPLHNNTITNTNILMRQPVNHIRKYYSYKKLSQSEIPPQICHDTLRNIDSTSHGMEQLSMYLSVRARTRT